MFPVDSPIEQKDPGWQIYITRSCEFRALGLIGVAFYRLLSHIADTS
jgi:hypothetical protein